MQEFYSSFTFILAFMILVILFNMAFGNTFVEYFLMLVLLSMIVVNADKFQYVFSGIKEV